MSSRGRGKGPSPTPGQQTQGGKGPAVKNPTTAAKIESTTGSSKINATKKDDLCVEGIQKFSADVQKFLNECSGKTINEKAATFIVRTKDNTAVDVDRDSIEMLMEVADPEILGKHRKDLKVLKSKDGKDVNIGDLFDKRQKTVNKGDKLSNTLDKSKEETEMLKKRNKSPNMSDISKTKGDEQKSEHETQPKREKSDLEDKFNAREVELKEKDDELNKKEKKIEEKDKELRDLQQKNQELEDETRDICKRYDEKVKKLEKDIDEKQNMLGTMEKNLEKSNSENKVLQEKSMELLRQYQDSQCNLEKANNENKNLNDDLKALQMQYGESEYALKKANRTADNLKEHYEDIIRHKDNQLREVVADRDDLRHRFSKLAGDKLTDQNPDIADLSDPNRAMKLSEKFGGLYDDQWTDAFEYLKGGKLKMPVKDAISLLLDVLRKCEEFCKKLKETQMDSLRNVLLHPVQDVSSFGTEPRKHVGGLKEHGRIKTPDQKAMRELRRQIGVSESVLEEVKQVFVLETKAWPDKKSLDGCLTYIQKCAEVCWLMVLHDPPLYMKMDVKPGDTLDPNLYSVYSASGNKIDFLVWPPLFNEKDGGLLSKGTAETTRVVKKP